MDKLTQREAINTIKKLYHIKEDCPIINSNGAWNDNVANSRGILQLNNYILYQSEYPILHTKKLIRREFGCIGDNASVLKHNYKQNQKMCILDLWEEILFHHGTNYSIDSKKNKVNSVRIQGIMFIELCQSEALPYPLIIHMAITLKKKRAVIYRIHRILSTIIIRKIKERCYKETEDFIKSVTKSLKNH